VTPEWLLQNLKHPQLRVIDTSWYMPGSNRYAHSEFVAQRIPGAQLFDIDKIADHDDAEDRRWRGDSDSQTEQRTVKEGEIGPQPDWSSMPHTMPSAHKFARLLGALGISHTDTVICYDTHGCFSSPRAWYMLRAMGMPAEQVGVLNGGLPLWMTDASRPLDKGIPAVPDEVEFHASVNHSMLYQTRDVRRLIGVQDEGRTVALQPSSAGAGADTPATTVLIDARSKARYGGEQAEPRPGLMAGHIPSSHNVPFSETLDSSRAKTDGVITMKTDVKELQATFAAIGVDAGGGGPHPLNIVTTCGSGVTAAILQLALAHCGHPSGSVRMYDGSWTEWAAQPDVVTTATASSPSLIETEATPPRGK
jgi:thiosulfate/3-mercaptopyruvate sulfurtransferase